MELFTSNPMFALVPVMLFVAAYIHQRVRGGRGFRPARFLVLAAGCAWLLYALYEFGIQRELKPESVPIRIDLAVIYPALFIVTAVGAAAYVFGFRRRVHQSPQHGSAA